MPETVDLDVAVRQRIITEAQAQQLRDLGTAGAGVRPDLQRPKIIEADDEPFQFVAGMNDAFMTIGVVLVMFAAASLSAFAAFGGNGLNPAAVISSAVLVALTWAGAEYFTGHVKAVGPSRALAIGLAIFSAGLATSLARAVDDGMFHVYAALALIPFAILLLHYIRFRFPFTLFLAAFAALTAVILAVASAANGFAPVIDAEMTAVFQSSKYVALFVGVIVFAIAMSYDMRDPRRTSRFHLSGFWLHLAAAPMIVHPVATDLIGGWRVTSGSQFVAALVILALLALIAIVIDRRAILVAGFGYLGGALVYAVTQLTGSATTPITPAVGLIGVLIITLSLGWRPIRRAFFSAFPNLPGRRFLPPTDVDQIA